MALQVQNRDSSYLRVNNRQNQRAFLLFHTNKKRFGDDINLGIRPGPKAKSACSMSLHYTVMRKYRVWIYVVIVNLAINSIRLCKNVCIETAKPFS
ncbi:hypothetical protein K2173_020440 [Erythroxylum novogranatense]|uniref:Uncharacterized protein n=1 Tax=Erythroxylum novogranatense TaxID=1862640 RepID=A0AAV8TIA9_9ROSI|nr:hypothetical protein K2173_020440 [Erythroxylum novogranatense]